MKLLYIADSLPYPPDTGSRNLIYHWLEAARRQHEVHLVVVGEVTDNKSEMPEFPNLRVEILPAVVGRTLPKRLFRLTTSAVFGIPATSLVCMPASTRECLRDMVEKGRYDAVVLTENVVAGYAQLLAPLAPVILFKHSVQAVDARDTRRRFGMYRPRWLLEEWIVKRFEWRTCRAATVVCCVNSGDATELSRRYRLARPAEVVPIGVDLGRFPRRNSDPGGKVVGFFGNLTWGANVDAAIWFADEVLPRVWEKHPDAQFRVIGPGSQQLPFYARDLRLVRVGPVPQTRIAEAMKDVAVGVVPIVSGTGVRLKLLEMLSMGIPTVSTSLGRLGTRCVDGEHILIADDSETFARAVSSLLSDSGLRRRLGAAGAELSRAHAWENSYPRILAAFELAVRRYSSGRSRSPELQEARSA